MDTELDRLEEYEPDPAEGQDSERNAEDSMNAYRLRQRQHFLARLRRNFEAQRIEQSSSGREPMFTDDYDEDVLVGHEARPFDEDDDDPPIVRSARTAKRTPLRR